jgi:hypothetical protein
VLVIEVKTEIASAEELLRRHDVKTRLAPKLAVDRFGARPAAIGRLLVIADSSTNRRRLDRLDPLLRSSYPQRGRGVRAWLAEPHGPLAGVIFVGGRDDRQVRSRSRVRRAAA